MLPDLLNLRSVPGLGSHPTSKSAKKHHLTYIHTSTYMISTNRKLSSKLNNGLGFNTETEKLTNSHTDVHTYIHTYITYVLIGRSTALHHNVVQDVSDSIH